MPGAREQSLLQVRRHGAPFVRGADLQEAGAACFGRITQENRFAQEDRELGLVRIISYSLPGQEFAALVALSLWNLRLVRGFLLDPPSAVRPVRRPRAPGHR